MERKKKKKRQNGRSEECYFQHLLLMSLQLEEDRQHGIGQSPDNCFSDLLEIGMLREKKGRKFCAGKPPCFCVFMNKL